MNGGCQWRLGGMVWAEMLFSGMQWGGAGQKQVMEFRCGVGGLGKVRRSTRWCEVWMRRRGVRADVRKCQIPLRRCGIYAHWQGRMWDMCRFTGGAGEQAEMKTDQSCFVWYGMKRSAANQRRAFMWTGFCRLAPCAFAPITEGDPCPSDVRVCSYYCYGIAQQINISVWKYN